MAQIYDRDDIRPKRTLTFNIQVTDEGETHGPPFRERRNYLVCFFVAIWAAGKSAGQRGQSSKTHVLQLFLPRARRITGLTSHQFAEIHLG
jgi:hypothetical protein